MTMHRVQLVRVMFKSDPRDPHSPAKCNTPYAVKRGERVCDRSVRVLYRRNQEGKWQNQRKGPRQPHSWQDSRRPQQMRCNGAFGRLVTSAIVAEEPFHMSIQRHMTAIEAR